MTPPELIAAAREAARHAHAPYSRFSVGAAVLLTDGSVVTGANFENASYGLSLCAETVAIAKAASEGRLRDVSEIAVIGGMQVDGAARGSDPVRPCGRCRQVLNEASGMGGRDITLYCAGAEGDGYEVHALRDLLPHAFGPADLGL
ncbi:cytidine deaminase [Sphingomonas baiyangensis]|uniref:Cytidine deaminase n=1 Tax=Sphingomonas baiyangensis TaxID=2572576 RepID=A0A4U1L0K3_9SPHN|nr:cytidine deaminase [Sphingomonas baiyangensis]TKD50094.1 cytidine deaminase [Sphingomonas baiyangensis]